MRASHFVPRRPPGCPMFQGRWPGGTVQVPGGIDGGGGGTVVVVVVSMTSIWHQQHRQADST